MGHTSCAGDYTRIRIPAHFPGVYWCAIGNAGKRAGTFPVISIKGTVPVYDNTVSIIVHLLCKMDKDLYAPIAGYNALTICYRTLAKK